MNSRWLFRCEVAKERENEDAEKARGLGHAMRCLALSRVVDRCGGDIYFSIEGAQDVKEYFDQRDIPCVVTTDHHSVIQKYNPDVVVVDINYFEPKKVKYLRDQATVVNLAPRGESKYYADLTFTNAPIEDVPQPSDACLQEWHAGPEYSILNPDFTSLRKQIDDGTWRTEKQGVVIQMGGVDQFNMTLNVLENLNLDKFSNILFQVIAGPFNPHIDQLKEYCSDYKNITFDHDPEDYAKVIAGKRLGIFATGISTFEGMAVGVPSINLGLSTFHDLRGKHLEKDELGYYLGRHDEFDPTKLNDVLESLLLDEGELEELRNRCMNVVDGKACERIVQDVKSYLTRYS